MCRWNGSDFSASNYMNGCEITCVNISMDGNFEIIDMSLGHNFIIYFRQLNLIQTRNLTTVNYCLLQLISPRLNFHAVLVMSDQRLKDYMLLKLLFLFVNSINTYLTDNYIINLCQYPGSESPSPIP